MREREIAWGEHVWSRARKRASDSATRRIYNTAHHKGRTLRKRRRKECWEIKEGTTTGTGDWHPPCGNTVSLPFTVTYSKKLFFFQYIFLYILKQMLHPTSSLVISWVILKLAKNQFPHTLFCKLFNKHVFWHFGEFLYFLTLVLKTKHQSCVKRSSLLISGYFQIQPGATCCSHTHTNSSRCWEVSLQTEHRWHLLFT